MAAQIVPAQGDQSAATVTDVLSIDTSLITVNVSVRDHKNRQLQGLRIEDFRVTDQGKSVRPELLETQAPLSIVFVIDVSSSMKTHWPKLHNGLKKFLARQPEGSDYTLIIFNEKARLVTSSVDAMQLWQSLGTLRPDGETALHDGLLLGLQELERVPRNNKALVLLSDGDDNSSHGGLESVEHQMLRHHATIYTVGLVFEGPSPFDAHGRKLLNQLAASTGGLVHFPTTTQLPGVLDSIRVDLSRQYSLSYYPPEKTPGWHRVEVNITRNTDRLTLRYQERYQMR